MNTSPLGGLASSATTPVQRTEPARPSLGGARSGFRDVLERIGRELERGERSVERAIAGGPTDAASMIALQAGIYRYSEAVELSAKLVEHTAAGLRTTLQGSG